MKRNEERGTRMRDRKRLGDNETESSETRFRKETKAVDLGSVFFRPLDEGVALGLC